MTRPTAYKLAIVAVTVFVCAGLLVAFPRRRSIDFVDHAALDGSQLTEETAKIIFPNLRNTGDRPRHRYDPDVGPLLVPDLETRWKWPEYDDPWLVMRTNAQGFREDHPTPTVKQGYRILVVGDSHTEGFVFNHESFANVLEAMLDKSLPNDGPFEAINAGVGGTNPWNYVQVVRKFLVLDPDMVVVCFFTGNDFYGSLAMYRFFTKEAETPDPEGYEERLLAVRDNFGKAPYRFPSASLGNGQNQAYRFKHRPEEIDISVRVALGYIRQIVDVCAENDIELVVVVLPTKPDVDLLDDRAKIAESLAGLELTDAEAALNIGLGRRLIEALEAWDVRYVDPLETMRARPEPFYWRKDYHLNPDGHALVGDMLLEVVVDIID